MNPASAPNPATGVQNTLGESAPAESAPAATVQQYDAVARPQTAALAASKRLMFWLKLVMLSGITLIIFGHYLWLGAKLPETMGVQGIIIVALCCALGLILSLPTKIYLTLLLMQYENEQQAIAQHNLAQNGTSGQSEERPTSSGQQ
ncbi:hypothetical protein [Rheinheimera sp.]|uniref:hypothetical protein n=1 Tax=Rheinheimera sp. TaxID=1869214 RepID=UPI002FDD0E07